MYPCFRYDYVRLLLFVGIFTACCLSSGPAHSQDLIQTMVQQIGRLEVTLQEAKQGYSIVQKGLSVISDIKKGDFDLHNNYFSSLSTVKGPIKDYASVADIVRMQLSILNDCQMTVTQLQPSGLYTVAQLAYCSQVFTNLAVKTGNDMDELTGILTDGNWQMSDDQRLSRIDALYKSVLEKYTFCQSFCNQARAIGMRRSLDLQSYSNLTKLF
jgi:hypothetical protein